MNDAAVWVQRFAHRASPRLRLFCFPYAGGAAQAFRTWSKGLPEHIDVCAIQPPGRWQRLHEPAFNRVPPMVEALASALRPMLDLPFAFYGHSLGSIVAFELCRLLRVAHGRAPVHLFVASRQPPQSPLVKSRIPTTQLSDENFIDLVDRLYGAIPPKVRAQRELMEIMLPALRADLEAWETYTYEPDAPFDFPISAFSGREDRMVKEALLPGWSEHTTRHFKLRMFDGGHLFFVDDPQPLLSEIQESLPAHVVSRHA